MTDPISQLRFDSEWTKRSPVADPTRVDLHSHSTRSDGILEPEDLWAAMIGCGLEVAAVSDHDTMSGYRALRDAALASGSTYGPTLIPAVEINSIADRELIEMGVELEEGELHILGYGVDAESAAFQRALETQRDARRIRLMMIIDALRTLGKPIDEQIAPVLESDEALGRPHIARAMVAAGYVETVQQAFGEWIDRNGPAYIAQQGMKSRAAIDVIRAAGGLPVLAHYPAAPVQSELIDLLEGWGLRGLEVYYRSFTDQTVGQMAEFAASRGLLATGGTDYHGDGITYAEARSKLSVPREVGDRLLEALAAPIR